MQVSYCEKMLADLLHITAQRIHDEIQSSV